MAFALTVSDYRCYWVSSDQLVIFGTESVIICGTVPHSAAAAAADGTATWSQTATAAANVAVTGAAASELQLK